MSPRARRTARGGRAVRRRGAARAASVLGVVSLGLLLMLAATPALAFGTAGAESADRRAVMLETLERGERYLEPQVAGGEVATWLPRLREAAAEVPGGAAVALWGPGATPTLERSAARTAREAGAAVIVVDWSPTPLPTEMSAAGPARFDADLDLLRERARAVEEDATSRRLQSAPLEQRVRHDDPARTDGTEQPRLPAIKLHPAARAWVMLRLLAPDAPSRGALVSEITGDPTAFVDRRRYVDGPYLGAVVALDDPTQRLDATVWLFAVALGYVLLTWLRRRRKRPATHATSLAPDQAARSDPAPTAHEVRVALDGLAEAIAAAPVALERLGYRRAQRCREAAELFAGSEADRDRVGVLWLCHDGQEWLAGRRPARRCYFNPTHRAAARQVRPTDVELARTAVPACAICGDLVRRQHPPGSLRLPHAGVATGVPTGPPADRIAERALEPEDVRPYYEIDDIWTRTGYGSLLSEWADQVLRDARAREERP